MAPNDNSNVDVLIIGAGPSGYVFRLLYLGCSLKFSVYSLMLATWMARLGIKTRIVDKRGGQLSSGYVHHPSAM
jgi:2-polyprenyl-6-methoxyphenol hydroxylase-like FAD-dependent oxidoreductase